MVPPRMFVVQPGCGVPGSSCLQGCGSNQRGCALPVPVLCLCLFLLLVGESPRCCFSGIWAEVGGSCPLPCSAPLA